MSKLANVFISSVYLGREGKWGNEMDKWEVSLEYGNEEYTSEYFMGTGHLGGEPSVEVFLENLFLDADFAKEGLSDFMGETGLEGEVAEETYEACKKIDKVLDRLFGDDRESIGVEIDNY